MPAKYITYEELFIINKAILLSYVILYSLCIIIFYIPMEITL